MTTCRAAACTRPAHARGLCNTHYTRYRKGADIDAPVRPQVRGDDEARFDAFIEMDTNGGCWLWSGATSDYGHGIVFIGGRLVRAHRHSYERFSGPVQDDLKVCHRCDVPQCVNPAHLFIGTQADNIADMVAKGRYVQGRVYRGSANARAKLTEDDVRRILAEVAAGRSRQAVANDNGVSRTVIYSILTGRSWRHVERRAA